MPYFQRGRLTDGVSPVGGNAGPELLAGDIVEKAAAILDEETRLSAGSPTGGMPGRVTGETSDAFAQLSQALAALLNTFLQSVPLQSVPLSKPAHQPPMAALPSAVGTNVPLILSEGSTRAGETAKVEVTVAKDGPGEASVTLYSTDFVSDTGFQIPSACATFSPRSVAVDGREPKKSEMRIAIPAQCGRGAYSALVQATGIGRPCAVVVLQVE
jgi:hypothetical protein